MMKATYEFWYVSDTEEKKLILENCFGEMKQESTYCTLKGYKLENHNIHNQPTISAARCALACTSLPECVSANYMVAGSMCCMKNATDWQYPGNFGQDANSIHLKLGSC